MGKSYYGKCGFCKHCRLETAYTFCYSTDFKCERNGYRVKADEKPCNRFELDPGRSNEWIAKYDK